MTISYKLKATYKLNGKRKTKTRVVAKPDTLTFFDQKDVFLWQISKKAEDLVVEIQTIEHRKI